jgi:hypothetical protein
MTVSILLELDRKRMGGFCLDVCVEAHIYKLFRVHSFLPTNPTPPTRRIGLGQRSICQECRFEELRAADPAQRPRGPKIPEYSMNGTFSGHSDAGAFTRGIQEAICHVERVAELLAIRNGRATF